MDATHDDTPPSPRRSGVMLAVVLLAAAALLYVVVQRGVDQPAVDAHPAIGRRLQFLHFEGLTGDARSVSVEDLAGRVTLVNYWGTWCPPCIRELPELLTLAARYGTHADFRFYPVSCGQGDDGDLAALRAETQEFLSARNTPMLSTYADQHGASRRAMVMELDMSPQNFAYPTTILFDRESRIRGIWEGYSPRAVEEMSRKVGEVLGEK